MWNKGSLRKWLNMQVSYLDRQPFHIMQIAIFFKALPSSARPSLLQYRPARQNVPTGVVEAWLCMGVRWTLQEGIPAWYQWLQRS